MTPADLKILVEEGEGVTLEFKENLSASFVRELVAMAEARQENVTSQVGDKPEPGRCRVEAHDEAQDEAHETAITPEVAGEVAGEVTGEVAGEVLRLLGALRGEMKRRELQAALGLKHERTTSEPPISCLRFKRGHRDDHP
jgi:hypothetical protein